MENLFIKKNVWHAMDKMEKKGDGPQAEKLSNPVAPIGGFDFSKSASPTDWFNIVTTERLQSLCRISEVSSDRRDGM